MTPEEVQEQIKGFRARYERIVMEIGKAMVGQQEIVEATLTAMLAGGHVLLEGVPGLGKTLLVKTLSQVLELPFQRIQFTPDLMPADILGTNIVSESEGGRRAFEFQKGPIFANLILADEINRATPKTQSALLEAMQERRVTAGGQTRPLPQPFFVLATQNPIEMEGTYPLPEAQVDRFYFKVLVEYPTQVEFAEILNRTTGSPIPEPQQVVNGEELLEMQRLAREVPIADHVQDYAIRLVMATHAGTSTAVPAANQFLRFGSSPRGAQTLVLAAKIRALLRDRYNVSFEDIRAVAMPALRHRLILNFEAQAEGVSSDEVLREILEAVPRDTQVAADKAKVQAAR
jgi:MoxR-like ATPase